MIGIYKITNIVTNKCYIGQSIDMEKRWKSHISMLNRNKHHSIKLQSSWNKHGEKSFIFDIVEECEITELNNHEKFYIEKYYAKDSGYNMDGDYEFYKILNKTENTFDLENFILKWDYLISIKDENVPSFYFWKLHFDLSTAKTLKKSEKILDMIKSIYSELIEKDYDSIYKLNYICFKTTTFNLEEYVSKNKFTINNNINCLLLEFLLKVYDNKKLKNILKVIHIPNDVISPIRKLHPTFYNYIVKTNRYFMENNT